MWVYVSDPTFITMCSYSVCASVCVCVCVCVHPHVCEIACLHTALQSKIFVKRVSIASASCLSVIKDLLLNLAINTLSWLVNLSAHTRKICGHLTFAKKV